MDEQGKPLYGDVFGIQQQEAPVVEEDEQIESQPWGELESESEEESESEVCVTVSRKSAWFIETLTYKVVINKNKLLVNEVNFYSWRNKVMPFQRRISLSLEKNPTHKSTCDLHSRYSVVTQDFCFLLLSEKRNNPTKKCYS